MGEGSTPLLVEEEALRPPRSGGRDSDEGGCESDGWEEKCEEYCWTGEVAK